MRDRFEVILNAIKTGVPITDPRSRFEEVINALVGTGSGLPAVTAADNGKILMVVNGSWAAAAIPDGNNIEY